MSRRAIIPQRVPIFLGTEGESEAGYGALLGKFARDQNLHVHLDVHSLQPGAGDPLALVEKAAQLIARRERVRSKYGVKALLIDIGTERKNREAITRARDCGIDHIIWQAPDHEAVILRHLEGCQQRRPPAGASMAALLREWPAYRKAMSSHEIGGRITLANIRLVCAVEPELAAFLRSIGFEL